MIEISAAALETNSSKVVTSIVIPVSTGSSSKSRWLRALWPSGDSTNLAIECSLLSALRQRVTRSLSWFEETFSLRATNARGDGSNATTRLVGPAAAQRQVK